MEKIEWYSDFVNPNYQPSKTDLVVLFYSEPEKGVSIEEAIGRIASESSTGTWTTLFQLPKRMKKLMATSFEVHNNFVKVAYPLDLWEPGNAPQLLSGIAGNIFGMKALKNLRLVDVSFPKAYLKHFPGPRQGIHGLRKLLKVYDRPFLGAVPKPKIGFSATEHAHIGFETWMGGFDLVKDDENLTSMKFNHFYERVKRLTKLREKAEKLTGQTKDALINITAETKEMQRRARFLHDYHWKYAMIDVVVAGTAAVQTLRETLGDYGMAIHAHRAMHAAFDKNTRHGISMQFLAKLMRMIGVDQIHSGTAVGKLVGNEHEVKSIATMLREKTIKEERHPELPHLQQHWQHIKPAFPVASGGLHPGLVPDIMRIFGNDSCFLVSGGIHGHPKGTRAGAKATVQALEATNKGLSLEAYARTHAELRQALDKWGHLHPV